MKKNKKEKYVDDGHTIYNMDVDGMPHRKRHNNDDNFSLTKNEKKAAAKAALAHYMPIILGVIVCFFFTKSLNSGKKAKLLPIIYPGNFFYLHSVFQGSTANCSEFFFFESES